MALTILCQDNCLIFDALFACTTGGPSNKCLKSFLWQFSLLPQFLTKIYEEEVSERNIRIRVLCLLVVNPLASRPWRLRFSKEFSNDKISPFGVVFDLVLSSVSFSFESNIF